MECRPFERNRRSPMNLRRKEGELDRSGDLQKRTSPSRRRVLAANPKEQHVLLQAGMPFQSGRLSKKRDLFQSNNSFANKPASVTPVESRDSHERRARNCAPVETHSP